MESSTKAAADMAMKNWWLGIREGRKYKKGSRSRLVKPTHHECDTDTAKRENIPPPDCQMHPIPFPKKRLL